MESFSKYLARDVNMTIATDTCPQSMIDAMRWSPVVSKIMDRRTEDATARDVFNDATLGGAKGAWRDDLGQIVKGAKADMLMWTRLGFPWSRCATPFAISSIQRSPRIFTAASSTVDG